MLPIFYEILWNFVRNYTDKKLNAAIFELQAVRKCENFVDLEKCCKMSHRSPKSVLIQPRKSVRKSDARGRRGRLVPPRPGRWRPCRRERRPEASGAKMPNQMESK